MRFKSTCLLERCYEELARNVSRVKCVIIVIVEIRLEALAEGNVWFS
jgi:hypothetical protein